MVRDGCCTWLLYAASGAGKRWSASARQHASKSVDARSR